MTHQRGGGDRQALLPAEGRGPTVPTRRGVGRAGCAPARVHSLQLGSRCVAAAWAPRNTPDVASRLSSVLDSYVSLGREGVSAPSSASGDKMLSWQWMAGRKLRVTGRRPGCEEDDLGFGVHRCSFQIGPRLVPGVAGLCHRATPPAPGQVPLWLGRCGALTPAPEFRGSEVQFGRRAAK